jgi:4-aminobutyrate aminotransferase-like enzyme
VACAKDLEELIRTTTTGQIAGFIAEPIQGVGGFVTPPKEYFEIAVGIVRKYGGVFICDEVQTGFGRTGTKWFGIEHWNVQPDIMTMAKGIANGLPLGATIATPEIADSFKAMTISTFGGNPVSTAAAVATLTVMEEENLPRRAEEMGGLLRDGLERLKKKYPKTIGDVRGMGLMQGLELVADETIGDRTPAPEKAVRLFEETKKRGLLIGKGGLYGNCIRISPPLVVSKSEVEEALRIFDESFAGWA